jgi:DNA-binding transcriptional regulator YiaG
VTQVSPPTTPSVDAGCRTVLQHLRQARIGLRVALATNRQDPTSRAAMQDADELVERALRRLTMSKPTPCPNERLRAQRLRRGWSQEDVAENLHLLANKLGGELGVDGTMVSRWERGRRTPRPRYARLLCRLFDASPEELGLMEAVTSQSAPDGQQGPRLA